MTKAAVAKSFTLHEWADGTQRSWPEPTFPSWYPASAGTVAEVSTATIAAAATAQGADVYPGTDSESLANAWGGGAIVYVSGQPYLVVCGGGHGDGSWNGFLKFGPLYGAGADSPAWSVFLAASDSADVQDGPTYADGRQASIHTYNQIVGVDDTLYAMSTDAYYSSGFASPLAFAFTPAGQSSLTNNPKGSGQYGAVAHYDGNIYYITGNGVFGPLRVYDIAGDSWSAEANADISLANYVSMAVDSERGGLLATNGTDAYYWDLSTLTRTALTNAPSSYEQCLEYDPDRDAFVTIVDNSLTIQEVDAASLAAGNDPAWTTRTFTGDTPSAAEGNGTFGRFRYVPELKGYVLIPGDTSGVYFYRSA